MMEKTVNVVEIHLRWGQVVGGMTNYLFVTISYYGESGLIELTLMLFPQ